MTNFQPNLPGCAQALAELSLLSHLDDDTLRALWRNCGGEFFGPNIETGTMPEARLLPFLRDLMAAAADQAREQLFRPFDSGDPEITGRRLLGYQMANSRGDNIQGDDNDPSGLPSFYVMNGREAAAVLSTVPGEEYLLMPIYEGDIEGPMFAQ